MDLPFLQELTEGRIYRDGSTVRDKSAEQLAEIVYLMFMVLEVMRYEDKGFARKYAGEILKWQEFNAMKNSANDMYNLLAVLSSQDKYDNFINSNFSIAIPTFQLFRYLRDLQRDADSHSLDRKFLMTIEDYLKVSKYKSIRRIIGDWDIASSAEKHHVYSVLNREMSSKVPLADIYTGAKPHLR